MQLSFGVGVGFCQVKKFQLRINRVQFQVFQNGAPGFRIGIQGIVSVSDKLRKEPRG